jgi:hydrogenase nickel incorporation protein HypA/HybF
MHEVSVCMAIVAQVERIAQQHDARVSTITLKLGPLSGVEASLLERAYPLAAAGTPLSEARLVIDTLPVRVRCRSCQAETVVGPNHLVCADCGDWHTDLLSGDELLLASVELDRLTITNATIQ